MRYVYMLLSALLTGAVLKFKFQNLEQVSVHFFSASLSLPVSVLVVAIYFLGMVSGGFVVSLVRKWLRDATRKAPLPRPLKIAP